jgi:hypothetical protein
MHLPQVKLWSFREQSQLDIQDRAAKEVNAIASGFLITHQNRFILIDRETGDLTPHGMSVVAHTPMTRFGERRICGAALAAYGRVVE